MKLKAFILAILLALTLSPVLAQSSTPLTRVSFNGISFAFDPKLATNVDVRQVPGDPKDLQQPGGPEVKHVEFVLYSGDTLPASYDSVAVLRIYKIADFAGYTQHTTQLNALQALLKNKTDLASYMKAREGTQEVSLPFLPVFPAAQVVRARAQYIETATVKGINYVTYYAQGLSPFTSRDFMFTFQGISADGSVYISAIFRPATTVFPKDIPADLNMDKFAAGYIAYVNDGIAKLNKAAPGDFDPSLTVLDALIRSISVVPAA